MMNGSPSEVMTRIARAPSLLVVCEFDGAIAVLAGLGSLPRTRAAIISGRSLASLSAVCPTDRDGARRYSIELVGSDGMEIEAQLTLGLTPGARRMQRSLLHEAARIADAHPGVTVDAKPYGVALNVRGAEAHDGRRAIEQLLEIARSMPQRVYSQSRSEVLDLSVLPVGQDWAIDALRRGTDATVFYAGNDQRALASLGSGDRGCCVGAGCADSSVRVASPRALVELLVRLHRERACLLDPG